ncbi:MAG: hypothetical protein RL095_1619 [Verrucomicrobiota bacterium]|jgi:hypothetical protein
MDEDADDEEIFLRRLRQNLAASGRLQGPGTEEDSRDLSRRYRRLRLAGEGALKECWEVEDLLCHRPAALLLCRSSDADAEFRFRQEIRLYSDLRHEGVASLYDAGRDREGRLFYVAEFLEGLSLLQRLRDGLAPEQALPLATQLLEVIAFAHARGVFHLDLKPDNIRVNPQGRLKVTDWEMAVSADSPHLRGLVRGTEGYMPPPEFQRSAEYSPARADLHALGILLLELFCGRPIDKQEPVGRRLAGLEHGLQAIIGNCLNLKQSDYIDATSLLHDWYAWLGGFAPEVEKAGLLRQVKLLIQRHRNLVVRLNLIFLLLLGLAVVYARHEERRQRQLEVALQGERQEKERRLNLLMQNHEVLLRELERVYLDGDLSQAEEYVRLLEPLAGRIDSWPLWNARLKLRRGADQASVAELCRRGNSRDLSLARYLGDRSPVNFNAFIYEIGWQADGYSIQALYSALAQVKDDPASSRAILSVLAGIRIPLRTSLLHLRDSYLGPEIEESLWKQAERRGREDRERQPVGLRADCNFARQIARQRGRTEQERIFEELKPSNLALGCKVWSDGYDERLSSLAVNGRTEIEDYWAAANFPRVLSLDLGRKESLGRLRLWLLPGPRYYRFRIWASDSPAGPRRLLASKDSDAPAEMDKPWTCMLPDGTSARYLHVEIHFNSVNRSVHLREIEVYK